MSTERIHASWDYLHAASDPSLESYEMSRLNHAANLRREVIALIEQWIEETAQALLARWVRQDRAVARTPAPSLEEPTQPGLLFREPIPAAASKEKARPPAKFSRRHSRTGTNG